MASTISEQLDALRDIHLPPDPPLWPPAVGWWLVLIVLVTTIVFAPRIVHALSRFRSRRRIHRQVRRLERRLQDGNDHNVIADLSQLLRSVAMRRFPEHNCTALTGRAWLEFLSDTGDDIDFRIDPGCRLADAPYRQHHDADVRGLLALTRKWLHQNA